ncbi:hypothetical protein KO489_10680 [Reinekea forsetii]|nr:hypothetical protein [Reinekea forsetii]
MHTPIKLCPLVVITLITGSLYAHNQARADDFDDAFSEDLFDTIEPNEPLQTTPSLINWQHEIGSRVIANINSDEATPVEARFSGVSGVQAYYNPELNINPTQWLDIKADVSLQADSIFILRSNEDWSSQDQSAREFSYSINQLTARVQHNLWQYSTGIQTLTLGLADAFSIANTLYAQDLSLPGLVDPKDASIPTWTSWASGSIGSTRVKLGVVHEHTASKLGAPGTDFTTPLSALDVSAEPFAIENMSAFLSLSGVNGALDWQLNANTQLQHTPTVKMQLVEGGLVPEYSLFARTQSVSAAASYVLGSTLLKAETGITTNLKAQSVIEGLPADLVNYNQFNAVVGLDYHPASMGRFMTEVQFGQVLNYDALNLMAENKTNVAWLMLYSKSWLRDTLTLQAQTMGFGFDSDSGRIQGLALEYHHNDTLSSTLRFIDYVAGDFPLLIGADDRDRLVFEVTYQF